MPPKKSMKSRVRKGRKNYGRKKRSQVVVNRALQPLAQRYITKHKYSESYTLQLTNSYTQVMNLNSLFDPNRTGVGHQPYGYDQLSALYNRYRVISCKYVINAYSGTNAIRYGCIASNDVPPINSMSELVENPRAQFRVQFPGGSSTRITGNVYLPSLMGRTKAEYMADDRYQSPVGSSPAELALLTIIGADITDASTNVLCTVTMEYTVEWFDIIPLEQS